MYFEFIRRFINDKRITNAGYTRKTVFIPINGWEYDKNYNIYDYLHVLNPLSVIFKHLKLSPDKLNVFNGIDFVFFGNNGYFKMNPGNVTKQDYTKFIKLK